MNPPTLFDTLAPVPPASVPSGHQHVAIIAALEAEGARGLTGEEASQRCGIRLASSATTRLEEMSKDSKCRDRFPVPFVYRSERKERATASGRLAYVWQLTDAGRLVAQSMRSAA